MKGETCCVPSGTSWHPSRCGRPAKVEVDGEFYCGIHNPIKAEARKAIREKEMRERYAEQDRQARMRHIEYRLGRIVLGLDEGDIEALKAEYQKLKEAGQ